MDAEHLLLDNLALVDRIVAVTCRRNRLTKEEGEDFASVVKVKLIANDYEVLRAFEGRSSMAAYLAAVIQRAYVDHCNHLWGRWRPSAEARRLGPLAVRLDTLVHRDGLTLDEACGLSAPEDRAEMQRLAALLPPRVKRRVDGVEQLEGLAGPGASPEVELIDRERGDAVADLERALAAAVEHLPAEDRLLLQLRIYEGVTLASAARAFGHDARQLYRRWEQLLLNLRKALEQSGYDAHQVAWALDARSAPSGGGRATRPSNGMG